MKEYSGIIFSPLGDDKKLTCKLIISEDSIKIEYHTSESINNQGFKIIHGIFNKLGKVTLIESLSIGFSTGAGTYLKKYSSEHLLVGYHIKDIDQYYFDRVNIEMTGLHNWTKITGIKGSLFEGESLSLIDHPSIPIMDNEEFSAEIYPIQKHEYKQPNNQFTLTETVCLRIKSKKYISFWRYLTIIKDFKKIIFLLSNQEIKSDVTTFYTKDNSFVKLYSEENYIIGKKQFINTSVKFSNIKNLKTIINNWFNNEDIKISIDLILEKSRNSNLSLENNFLNNCFAIETFHRRIKNYKNFEKEKFKQIKTSILQNIEDLEIQKIIENNLAHINEPNFKLRLMGFENDFDKILCDKFETHEYIRKIVKSRNYLVHRGNPKSVFSNFDMLYSAIYLKNILILNIFRLLQMEEELIEEIAIEMKDRIQGMYYANFKRGLK
jgi:hypothetical protein